MLRSTRRRRALEPGDAQGRGVLITGTASCGRRARRARCRRRSAGDEVARRARALGRASIVPSVRPRQSSTPCHSGVAHASASSSSGSCEIGKNVPGEEEHRDEPEAEDRRRATSVRRSRRAPARRQREREAEEQRGREREHGERGDEAAPNAAIAGEDRTATITRIAHHRGCPTRRPAAERGREHRVVRARAT